MGLRCCVIGGECGLEGFLDLGPGLVCISNAFVFKLGEPSFDKGFSILLRKTTVLAELGYLSLWRVKWASMAMSHLLASSVSLLNSLGRAALISMLSSSSSD